MVLRILLPILLFACNTAVGVSFCVPSLPTVAMNRWRSSSPKHDSSVAPSPRASASSTNNDRGDENAKVGDNKSMSFLRKMGRVGGAANMDFASALGLDESPSGGTKSAPHEDGFKNVRKSKASYVPCTISGIIDDVSDPFPFTSSGSQWQGITDRVMGGRSDGSLSRETIGGRLANVLRGKVSMANNGGFIQMTTDLSSDLSKNIFVDASAYDGIEFDLYCEGMDVEGERFNVHLRTPACERQNSSYRYSFFIPPGQWTPVRIPWSAFEGHGSGPDVTPFVPLLRRLGVVSLGEARDVILAVGKVGFYNVICDVDGDCLVA